MKKLAKFKKKLNNFLFDHYKTRITLDWLKSLFFAILGAAIFAIGYSCFILPQDGSISIVTGGVSGVTQTILLGLELGGVQIDTKAAAQFSSIFYFALNLPICIFAFFFVGKKFAIMTMTNVIISSLFITAFQDIDVFVKMSHMLADDLMAGADSTNNFGGLILRIIFAAVCTGVSSAVAFRGGCSYGGIDVFSYYFALRKSTSVGKYALLINSSIVLTYLVLLILKNPGNEHLAIFSVLLAVSYLFICAMVVDLINVRNKKVQLQIITDKEYMSDVLISNFTHSATVLKGKGAYSQKDKYSIYMVVSSVESKDVIALARQVDEHAFISVTQLVQVYGNFFIRPVE